MSDKHSLILEFLGLNPGEWQDSRVEEYFAKEYGALAKLLDQHAAEQWDTIASMLEELKWQWDEALKKQREACEAAMYHAVRKYMPQDFPLNIVSKAILNARVEKSDETHQ